MSMPALWRARKASELQPIPTDDRFDSAALNTPRIGSRQRLGFTFAWKPFHAPDVATLISLFEAGPLKPIIDRRFTLDDAPEALRYMDDGHARGKVVLT